MRKIAIPVAFLSCILWFSLGWGQELKISDFRVPSYKSLYLLLSTDLSKYYYDDEISYNIWLIPAYKSISDISELVLSVYLSAERRFNITGYRFCAGVDIRHYLSNLFLHGRGSVNSWNFYYFHEDPGFWRKQRNGNLEAGFGIGHLREGMFTNTALHINEILKKENIIQENLSDASILAIAQLISKKQYFWIEHDRYEKFMFAQLQEIIEADPAFTEPVTAYAWFRIFDLIDGIPLGILYNDVVYWSRRFGSRLGFDFLGTNITDCSDRYDGYGMRNLPMLDSVYYVPGLRLKYDYGNPLSLRSHLMFSTSYLLAWYDSVTTHTISSDLTYSYGIIDNILIEGVLNVDYLHINADYTTSQGIFYGYPQVKLSYYIEDRIKIGLELEYFTSATVEYDEEYDVIFQEDLRFELNTDWYIF